MTTAMLHHLRGHDRNQVHHSEGQLRINANGTSSNHVACNVLGKRHNQSDTAAWSAAEFEQSHVPFYLTTDTPRGKMKNEAAEEPVNMKDGITAAPPGSPDSFLGFPLALDLDNLDADIAILGVPFGLPYVVGDLANDQSRAPDAIRQNAQDAAWEEPRTRFHFDWDLGGPLLDNRPVKVVDCGNVTSDPFDPNEHYRRAQTAAEKIFQSGATLITLGGDHGIPIPIMRSLPKGERVTVVQVDAHMDWRDSVNGVREGYSSPMRRASEMDWIGDMVQIGLRGVGSGRSEEVDAARSYGAQLISAYEMHDIGMDAVLERIPEGGPYYLTVDADGLDPTIMPAVNAPTPGGLTWIQIHKLIHGLVKKGRVLGMDLVEISPAYENGTKTLVHAERLICNFIGATVRAGYYD